MREHPYFKNMPIYHPNAWDKHTCDKKWTDFNHPCRGTFETCQKEDELKKGKPREKECCWRYSFNYQLKRAKKLKLGFMVQIVEFEPHYDCRRYCHQLGDGQLIEVDMALRLNLKIFQVFQPQDYEPTHGIHDKILNDMGDFTAASVDLLAKAVEQWRKDGCKDTSITRVAEDISPSLLPFIGDDKCISNFKKIPGIIENLKRMNKKEESEEESFDIERGNSLKELFDSKLNTVSRHIINLHEDVKKMNKHFEAQQKYLEAQQKQQILEFAISCAHLESFVYYVSADHRPRESGDLVENILKYFALNKGFILPSGNRLTKSSYNTYSSNIKEADKDFRTKLIGQIDTLIRRKSCQVYEQNGDCIIYYS